MNPMELTLTFQLEPMSVDDIDALTESVREAIEEKFGEVEFEIEDVRGLDITLELYD